MRRADEGREGASSSSPSSSKRRRETQTKWCHHSHPAERAGRNARNPKAAAHSEPSEGWSRRTPSLHFCFRTPDLSYVSKSVDVRGVRGLQPRPEIPCLPLRRSLFMSSRASNHSIRVHKRGTKETLFLTGGGGIGQTKSDAACPPTPLLSLDFQATISTHQKFL